MVLILSGWFTRTLVWVLGKGALEALPIYALFFAHLYLSDKYLSSYSASHCIGCLKCSCEQRQDPKWRGGQFHFLLPHIEIIFCIPESIVQTSVAKDSLMAVARIRGREGSGWATVTFLGLRCTSGKFENKIKIRFYLKNMQVTDVTGLQECPSLKVNKYQLRDIGTLEIVFETL